MHSRREQIIEREGEGEREREREREGGETEPDMATVMRATT